jgi:hypothetical protein
MPKNLGKAGIGAIRRVLTQLINEGAVQKTRLQKSDRYSLKGAV